MFSMEFTPDANVPMIMRDNNRQTQQQMFPSQYGYAPSQPQSQPQPPQSTGYFTAYPNTNQHNANKGNGTNSYMQPGPQPGPFLHQPQQQMVPYGYAQHPQGNPYMEQPARYQGGGNNVNVNRATSFSFPGGGRGGSGNYSRGGRGNFNNNANYNYNAYPRQVHSSFYYNQQHHYNSNNAVPEKTPTLQLMNPATGKTLRIKLNRIYTTMADLRPQLQNQQELASGHPPTSTLPLCMDFLHPRGCIHGGGCEKVHVAGLEYSWLPINSSTTPKDGSLMYNPGFRVLCYGSSLSRYYNIPSEYIHVSRGSTDYIAMYNEHGDNFKAKFRLCPDVTESGVCDIGEICKDIHCNLKDLESVRECSTSVTHVNNFELMADAPRLPTGMTVRVFDQNSIETYNDYPGSSVLITEGARNYMKQLDQEMGATIPSKRRMQHCAHFRLKEMCRLGDACRFLHVLPSSEEAARARRLRQVSDTSSDDSPNQSTHDLYDYDY